MNRYLQITFVPHVENGWNFFMWLTNKVGEPQFFPDLDDPLADFPDWLTDESYKLLRTSVSFVSDDQTESFWRTCHNGKPLPHD
ncbi:hypothetical protein QS257_16135 [Terrilactibacillus sp. S3-3]|nr:hypothetical protein QS257_16135 [Terrilactibacillus sp. S3-3]